MKNTVHWLNFLSAIFGFLSVIALASATIGREAFESFLKRARRTEESAGGPDPVIGVPSIVVAVSFLFVLAVVVVLAAFPEARTQLLTIKRLSLLILALAMGGWVIALACMVVIEGAIAFADSLSWLETRRWAGWIGFALLLISFTLLVASTAIEALNIEPVAASVSK